MSCPACVVRIGGKIPVTYVGGLPFCSNCGNLVTYRNWYAGVSPRYIPPKCPVCDAPMLRWSWWDYPPEPIVYWYCLCCDRHNIEPCIHTTLRKDLTVCG